jgi:hypothetical protein
VATSLQVEEFREANRALVTLAQSDLTDFWSALDTSGDPVRIRNLMLEFFPDLVQSYGDTAAVLGADWYDLLRDVPPSAASFNAVLAAPAVTEQAQASVRWAVGPLFDADPDTALAQLLGSAQRLVLQPGRDTVWDAAAADPVRTGVARVPSGTDTCSFCIMLASRGPVYQSQVSAELVVGRGSNRTGYDANGARLSGGIGGGIKTRGNRDIGNKFHDSCDCVSVVIRSQADYPEGYDPDRYLEMYQQGAGEGRYAPAE